MQEWGSCVINIGGVEVPTLKCLEVVFSNTLTVIASLAVFALFIMFIVGGFKYLTSAGDPKKSEEARHTMTYATAGVGLMVIAFLIFRLIEVILGVKITEFVIPTQ